MQAWQGPIKVGAFVLAVGALAILWRHPAANRTAILATAPMKSLAAALGASFWSHNPATARIGERAFQEMPQHAHDIGISLYTHDAADYPTLLRGADQALYEVKASDRNNLRFCSNP